MINNTTIVGRLTKDPQIKKTTNGISVLSFDIAVDRYYKNKEKKTDFIPCVAWRNTAEFIVKFFSKGDLIGIEGTVRNRTYQDKNGNNRRVVEIIVLKPSFVAPKKKKLEEEHIVSEAEEQQEAPSLHYPQDNSEDYQETLDDFYDDDNNEDDFDLPFN